MDSGVSVPAVGVALGVGVDVAVAEGVGVVDGELLMVGSGVPASSGTHPESVASATITRGTARMAERCGRMTSILTAVAGRVLHRRGYSGN